MKQKAKIATLLALILSAQALAPQSFVLFPRIQPACAQSSTATDEDEPVRITTNLVQLDFVVTDKRGNPVTDLTADDVEILQDGRPQKITNFSYISTGPTDSNSALAEGGKSAPGDKITSQVPPARASRENVRRTIGIIVDDLGMSFPTVGPARGALRKFIEQQMQPGDLVAIIRTGGEVGALQQFTNNKRQLLASVDRLRWNPCSRRGLNISPRITANTQGQFLGLPGGIRRGEELPACSSAALGATFEALRFIVGGMRDLPGRKSIIVFSDSIPVDLPDDPTLSLRSNNSNLPGAANIDNRSYSDALRRISELAIRASVVIYGVDTRGLTGLGLSASDDVAGLSQQQLNQVITDRTFDMVSGRDAPESMARQTGGFVVKNNNDISMALGRVLNDLRGYYLVGYRPNSETFNRRFHKITARVPNRPDLVVRTRSGFFGLSEEEETRSKTPTAADRFNLALTSPFAAGDIDLQLTPLFTNLPATGSFLRTLLHIDPRGLTFKQGADGWDSADIVLRGVLFGDNGKIVDEHRRAFTLRLRGATLKRVQSKGLDYVFNMPVKKPGAYQFRIAMLDQGSSHVGSAGQFVEVPDVKKDRLALSGLVIRGVVPGGASGATPSVAESTDGPSETPDSEATPALRRFQRHMLLDYTYVVFNARADKATGQPKLTARVQLFRDGQPVFDNESAVQIGRQIDATRAIVAGRLQLGSDMAPGEYVLQITVTDPLAKQDRQTATQWIDFVIVK